MPENPGLSAHPAREAVTVWAVVLGLLGLFKYGLAPVLPYGGSITGALAVAAFLWVPSYVNRRCGREDPDYGLTLAHWPRDVLFALGVMALVFPPFVAVFRAFLYANDHWIPRNVASWIAPYGLSRGFHWRLPGDLLDVVGGNIAVALGEEFFYRGYLLDRLSQAFPATAKLLGQPFGRAALLETALFATGHLLTPAFFRLGTFFPGLLFTWMALRAKGVLPSAIVHAGSNILIATLEASAFGVGGHLR